MNEEELLQQIAEADSEYRMALSKVNELKKTLLDAETVLININLHRARLREQLRVWRNQNVDDMETTDREEDIARFRKVLPELLKKV